MSPKQTRPGRLILGAIVLTIALLGTGGRSSTANPREAAAARTWRTR